MAAPDDYCAGRPISSNTSVPTGRYLQPACTFQLSARSVTGEPSAATVVLLVSTVAADLAFVRPSVFAGVAE